MIGTGQITLEELTPELQALIGLSNKSEFNASGMSSEEFTSLLGMGWNLGNTLDSWHDDLTNEDTSYWETLWGNPVTTKRMIEEVKKAGFKTVRVPVTWRANIDSDNLIMDVWMDRVEEVVNYVLDCGMFCIINVHHDTGDQGKITAELDRRWEMEYNLKRLWQQIGTRFKDYDYRLVFEGFNEILNLNCENLWLGDAESYEAVNLLNQAFVDEVRSIKGNENRFLLCATYGAQGQHQPLSAFEVPHDSAQDRIILRLNPYFRTREGLAEVVQSIRQNVIDRGITCYITETGVLGQEDIAVEERISLVYQIVSELKKLGLNICCWDDNLDRENLEWKSTDLVNVWKFVDSRISKQNFILDKSFNFMDNRNYIQGEYSFNDGLFFAGETKLSLKSYIFPVYSKYTFATHIEGITFIIAQMDENYELVEVAVQGAYGGFTVNPKTRCVGITLFSDDEEYDLETLQSWIEQEQKIVVEIPTDAVKINNHLYNQTAAQVNLGLESQLRNANSRIEELLSRIETLEELI